MPQQALSDMRVLDLTHYVVGPYCTKLLADYGADVVKVERAGGGDGARYLGPFAQDDPHHERSGLFLHLNTNKRSLTLNLKTEAGKKVFWQLAKEADVVVESFRPGVMERLGLGYEEIKKVNPTVVLTSISNFGQWGPYRDYRGSDITFYAMGGEMYSTGLEDREPVRLAHNAILYQAGAVAAMATVAAFLTARYQGVGQQVDISIMETQAGSIDRRVPMSVAYQYSGDVSPRLSLSSAGFPFGVYPCKNGYFEIWGGLVRFPLTLEMLEDIPELQDPRWRGPNVQDDPELRAEFEGLFISWCMERTKKDIWRVGQAHHVLVAPLNTMEDLGNDEHFTSRGAFAEMEHPVVGRVRILGRPFIMNETPWQLRRPAPLLGQHNEEVLIPLGYSREDIVRLREQNAI